MAVVKYLIQESPLILKILMALMNGSQRRLRHWSHCRPLGKLKQLYVNDNPNIAPIVCATLCFLVSHNIFFDLHIAICYSFDFSSLRVFR